MTASEFAKAIERQTLEILELKLQIEEANGFVIPSIIYDVINDMRDKKGE